MVLLRPLLLTAISVLLPISAEAILTLAALATGLPMQNGDSVEDSVFMLDGRIIGGEDTTIEKYPHQVSVEDKYGHVCGGSLISANFVVTSAHCVYGFDTKTRSIRAGMTKRGNGAGTAVKLAKIAYNPNFNLLTHDGDVAVLKLETPLTLSDKIKPIALVPINKEPAANEILTVTGWGLTEQSDPPILKVVDIPVVDRGLCRRAYKDTNITETMICAGDAKKTSCYGDNGGPLINSKRELVGIVSFGYRCGYAGHPAVFANVANPFIHNFITDFVNSNQ